MEILYFLIVSLVMLVIIFVILKTTGRHDNAGSSGSDQSKSDYTRLYGAPLGTAQGAAPESTPPAQAPAVQGAVPAVPAAPPPKPAAPKKTFSPILLLQMAGIIFLFLGGIIFLTSTWDMLADAMRAAALLSVSALAFGIHALAERVLKLPKTGLAFYILGAVFLPLALGGIGTFSLLGEWFSFSGGGRCLLGALMCASVSAVCFLGQSNYKNAVLAGFGLTGLGGVWLMLCLFLVDFCEHRLDVPMVPVLAVYAVLLAGFAGGMSYLAERSLRRNPQGSTPLSKAWIPYLYAQNAVWLLMMLIIISDAPAVGGLGALIMAVLFLNERFIVGKLHPGVFGSACSLMSALYAVCDPDVFSFSPWYEYFIFITAGTVLLLLTAAVLPKLRTETRSTMWLSAMILSIPALFIAVISMLLDLEHSGSWLLFLFVPLAIALIRFAVSPKHPLTEDTPHFALSAALLYPISIMLEQDPAFNPLLLLLLAAALLLLVQFFFSRRLWTLALSICTFGAAVLTYLPYSRISINCLCAAALLCGMIYAHLEKRPVLERGCIMTAVPFLLTVCCDISMLHLTMPRAWVLTFALLALVYLVSAALLRNQPNSVYLSGLCMDLAVFSGIFVLVKSITGNAGITIGWFVPLSLSLAVFAVGTLRRTINLTALPMLLYLFFALRELLTALEHIPQLSDSWVTGLQVTGYLLILLLFAGMGRLLLPHGFCRSEGKYTQIDWGLLTAAMPVFAAAFSIDWYPSILCCLLLSVYSLLYIGRVKTRFVPSLLASAFGCLTIFLHNVEDPFGILARCYEADFRTPQILLYLLPMHVFIASMLFILPKHCRSSVHMARFLMYCFTMFTILAASLSFNHAVDGILLAVFSLAILIGSFFVKRLRWFILGFSVLFLMTVKLTWAFWKSLHWGIYLFLAGALLLGIAFYYEYAVRRADERAKKGEPKENFRIFKEWRF